MSFSDRYRVFTQRTTEGGEIKSWRFQLVVPPHTKVREDMAVFEEIEAWCAENLPKDAVTFGGGGYNLDITDPTYATAFRIRWC